ncbi:MAG: Ku protein [Candidatus Dormibacteraeota bacterium]|nr:Ku protein [Candidatus Dormibacteraeota bacterium]
MPRAIWTGTISFGLVNIPVRVYPATRRKDVRFHEIDRVSGQRVHHQRVRLPWPDDDGDRLAAPTLPDRQGRSGFEASRQSVPPPLEVRAEEVVKGFEVAPGSFVTVTPEEIEELRPERTKTIDIEEFVAGAEVDPIHFDTAYHVVPQREYERPFALLVEALAASEKLAICWIVLRKRRHLAALRPREGVLLLSTMYFADEVIPVTEIAPRPAEQPSERELKMAALLVESMSSPFEPLRYEDGYRKRLLELIASRSGEAVSAPEPAEPVVTSGVEELMAALEASLKQVRGSSRKRRAV